MTIMDILTHPHEILRQQADPVESFDEALRSLVEDLLETMYQNQGIGLAANQVGVTKRLLVLDVSPQQDRPEHFINPEIIATEGRVSSKEGCLSIPEYRETIQRHEQVTVRAQRLNGEPFEVTATGLYAICLQHEIDHLNGILFIDYLSSLKKTFFNKWLLKNHR